MTSLCSLIHTAPNEVPLSSIFFPPAECNLYEYITDYSKPPASYVERMHNFRQMLSICRGLQWLAKNLVYIPARDRHIYQTYYHCDLKPENILVCEPATIGSELKVFKIADFGQAINLQQKPHDLKKLKMGSVAVPGRESPYVAPEAQDQNDDPKVLSKSDVWSFGCILLLLIIYNYESAKAIVIFQQERKDQSDPSRRGDNFFDIRTHSQRNEAVTNRINTLIQQRENDEGEDNKLTHDSLLYLKEYILVRHKRRDEIDRVSDKLHQYYEIRPAVSARKVLLHDSQDPQHLTYSCCGYSPTGVVFIYASEAIKVYYDWPKFPPLHIRPTSNGSKWSEVIEPESRSCAEESLCVVTTTKDSFRVCTKRFRRA
jgi:serine/threonine protein kinase